MRIATIALALFCSWFPPLRQQTTSDRTVSGACVIRMAPRPALTASAVGGILTALYNHK